MIIRNIVPSRPTTERHISEDKYPQILVISAVGQFKLNRLREKITASPFQKNLQQELQTHSNERQESNILPVIRKICVISGFPAKKIRSTLFCVITQRVVVISYRRFGTTYRSHLLGSIITTTPCVITQREQFSSNQRNNHSKVILK